MGQQADGGSRWAELALEYARERFEAPLLTPAAPDNERGRAEPGAAAR
jgi:hypothetical protein